MKTILATIGALAVAASLSTTAQAGSDGFDVRQEANAVTRGDYSGRSVESIDLRSVVTERAALRSERPVADAEDYRQNENLAPR